LPFDVPFFTDLEARVARIMGQTERPISIDEADNALTEAKGCPTFTGITRTTKYVP
jgi:hypothetical protein